MKNNIKIRRKEQGFSQEELAKKCGVSRQTVNAIENNKYDPDAVSGVPYGQRITAYCRRTFLSGRRLTP